jgi:tetratricopeptide (TPR) repeat protein
MALTDLGKVSFEQGEVEQALKTAREALTVTESINDTWGLSHALQFLGDIHHQIGEWDAAIGYFERSLPHVREIGDHFAEGVALANLSILYNLKEDHHASGHAAEQAFIAFQAIGDELQQPFPLRMMGYSAINAGNLVRARTLIVESLKGNRGQDHLPGQLACLVAIGACELTQDNAEKAATYATLVENRINSEAISYWSQMRLSSINC